MPFMSNSESVRRCVPSALAVIESIAATSISFWLAWRLASIQHVVFASMFAPFLLLRTKLSTWYTIRVANNLLNKVDGTYYMYLAGLMLFPIKLYCSTIIFLKRPLKSIAVIPTNFYKQIFVIDLKFPPQIFPGAEEISVKPSFAHIDLYMIAKVLLKSITEDWSYINKEVARKHLGFYSYIIFRLEDAISNIA